MSEQDINAANGDLNGELDLEKEIADAESLLFGKAQPAEEPVVEQEPINEETAEAGQTPEVKKEHSDRSKFGRRLTYLENKLARMDSIDQKVDLLISKLTPEHEDELPEIPTGTDVVDIVNKTIERREQEKINAAQKAQEFYQAKYMEMMEVSVGDDQELMALLSDPKSPFTKTSEKGYFGDPVADLLRNVTNAQKFLRTQSGTPKPNVHGQPSLVKTGVNIPKQEVSSTVRKVDTSRWSKDERDLANSGLFTEEELANLARL